MLNGMQTGIKITKIILILSTLWIMMECTANEYFKEFGCAEDFVWILLPKKI